MAYIAHAGLILLPSHLLLVDLAVVGGSSVCILKWISLNIFNGWNSVE